SASASSAPVIPAPMMTMSQCSGALSRGGAGTSLLETSENAGPEWRSIGSARSGLGGEEAAHVTGNPEQPECCESQPEAHPLLGRHAWDFGRDQGRGIPEESISG